jgi:4-hydroxy-2-oxoheptanedioate aldolase
MTDERFSRFAGMIRDRAPAIGYWCVLDAPPAVEQIARIGYDYVVLDGQHGLIGTSGILHGLIAIDAGRAAVGLVRVAANDPTPIGRALDAGAAGVIVPLVDSAADAALAVRAARYPPAGSRSFGPTRAALRVGPDPADTDRAVLVLAMIETASGLDDVEQICRVPGLDGVYVGPSDLRLSVGGRTPTDAAVDGAFDAALCRIRDAAAAAGIAAGIHTFDGDTARRRLAEGFTFVSIAGDLNHLVGTAAEHLQAVNR